MIATENKVTDRAVYWARCWYPVAEITVARCEDGAVDLLVEVDGDIRIVRYTDLDRARP